MKRVEIFCSRFATGSPGSRWNFTSIAASTTCSTRAHLSFQHFNQSHSGLDSLLQLSYIYICRFRPSKYVFLFVMLTFLKLWTQYPGSVVPLAMFLSNTYFENIYWLKNCGWIRSYYIFSFKNIFLFKNIYWLKNCGWIRSDYGSLLLARARHLSPLKCKEFKKFVNENIQQFVIVRGGLCIQKNANNMWQPEIFLPEYKKHISAWR